jgi:serine/threonine-protein kinase HipA
MLISGDNRLSKLKSCLDAAPHFHLSESAAKTIFEKQREAIESNWEKVCDEANLSTVDRRLFWKRQFLNPFAFED